MLDYLPHFFSFLLGFALLLQSAPKEDKTGILGRLRWTNIAGQVVKTSKTQFNSGLNAQLLDISELNQGLYILTIESEKGVLNKKIIVNR